MASNPNVYPDPDPARDGRFAYACPDCDFVSYGWPTKTAASERGDQHQAEHETGNPVAELADSGIKGAVQEG